MNFTGLTLGRGVLRLYIVLWLCWVLVLFFSNHRALLTSVGVSYWGEESVAERHRTESEEKYKAHGCDDTTREKVEGCYLLYIDTLSIPVGVGVTKDDAEYASKVFVYSGVIIPLVFLLSGFFLWFLAKWGMNGFLGSSKK
jgi:hypothetical protein